MLLADCSEFADYLENRKGLSKNTQVSYLRDVEGFLDYLVEGELLDLTKINVKTIEGYFDWLESRHRSPSTKVRTLALSAVFNIWCCAAPFNKSRQADSPGENQEKLLRF
ncbi:MAG: site-specific integrase [Hydrogeniiclostridium mannosilyticum]